MSRNRSSLILAVIIVTAMGGLLFLWSGYRTQRAEIQQTLDRADRNAAAAKAAATDAAGSAAQAIDAARDARNKLPGLF